MISGRENIVETEHNVTSCFWCLLMLSITQRGLLLALI